MTVRPILFSAPMVRAILREIEKPGTGKTQTRRTLSAGNLRIWNGGLDFPGKNVKWPAPEFAEMMARNARDFRLVDDIVDWKTDPAPYQGGAAFAVWQGRLTYAPGDVLWVRETWAPLGALTHNDPGVVALANNGFYKADGATVDGEISRWTPAIHMPRNASRLTLEVTGVKVERLQDISEADAIAEGIAWSDRTDGYSYEPEDGGPGYHSSDPRQSYFKLWELINGDDSVEANPWVVAVSFRPHLINVDAFLAQKEAA